MTEKVVGVCVTNRMITMKAALYTVDVLVHHHHTVVHADVKSALISLTALIRLTSF